MSISKNMNLRSLPKSSQILMFHKPKGVVVSLSDERKRKTVYDLLPQFVHDDKWRPVGRLDKDSRGLLLFTRKCELVNRLTMPGQCLKIYEVWVRGRVTKEHIRQVLIGVDTTIGILKANRVKALGGACHKTRLLVELFEGKNRHIRRMFGALQDPKFHTPLKVTDLKRIQVGTVKLDIPSSHWRFLTSAEEEQLLTCTEFS